MSTQDTKKQKRNIGLNLFGLVFLTAGLCVIAFGPLDTVYQHWRSASWPHIPATLNAVDVESHSGDNGYTYSLSASYSYQFNGRQYVNTNVGYDSSSDNVGDYHRKALSRLQRAQALNRVRIWVNPNDPTESYLLRDLRPQKLFFMFLFGGIFALVGVAIMFSGKIFKRASATHAEAIFSSERHGHWVLAFMGFIFLAVSFPVLTALPDEIKKGNYMVLVALVFPVVGLVLAYAAWKMRRNWQHYGPVPLMLAPYPGQLGGDIAGDITLSKWISHDQWRVNLVCVRIRQGRGKNSSTTENVIWQKEQEPYVHMQGSGASLRFAFTPPTDLPVTDESGRDKVEWRVILEGPKKPVPLERTYVVPVVQGTEQAVVPLPQSHVQRSEKRAYAQATVDAAEQIDVVQTAEGLMLQSRVGRNGAMTWMLLLMGLIFAGASVGMAVVAAKEGLMLYFMAFVFGLFGFPMFFGGVFMAGRSLDARISNGDVVIIRRWGGRALWQRKGRLDRADQLVLTSAGSVTSGNKKTEYFHLEVNADGKNIRLAEGLAGRDVAEAMQKNILRLLRLV